MRVVALALAAGGLGMLWWSSTAAGRGRRREARFVSRHQVGALRRRHGEANRLPLGTFATPRWRRTRTHLASPTGDSVLILGPTRSGKTSSLVVPALLSWQGPIVAASVKDDLVGETAAWRRQQGPCFVVDPSAPHGELGACFDPVTLSTSFEAARAMAADLATPPQAAVVSGEMAFWSQLAAKLLAPLLLAASVTDADLATVIRWVDRRALGEPWEVLEDHGLDRALDALGASLARDERQLGSVYATLEAILEPLAMTVDAAARPLDPVQLLRQSGTLYLCAPTHQQRRFQALFTATTSAVLRHGFDLARRQGGRLDQPLLVVLDEAAAIAPLEELDVLAATCAGHGITLVTCFQDLAQIRARYQDRATTVVNNHRTRVLLGGLADEGATSMLGAMTGTAREPVRPRREASALGERRALIEPHELRAQPAFTGVVISGRMSAVRLRLLPWWKQRDLRMRGPGRPRGVSVG